MNLQDKLNSALSSLQWASQFYSQTEYGKEQYKRVSNKRKIKQAKAEAVNYGDVYANINKSETDPQMKHYKTSMALGAELTQEQNYANLLHQQYELDPTIENLEQLNSANLAVSSVKENIKEHKANMPRSEYTPYAERQKALQRAGEQIRERANQTLERSRFRNIASKGEITDGN